MDPATMSLLVGLLVVVAFAAGFFLADRSAAHWGYGRGWADRERLCRTSGHCSPEMALVEATRPSPPTQPLWIDYEDKELLP